MSTDLSNKSVKVGVCRSIDVQVSATNIVDSFIVHHERAVGVLQRCMSSQDRVVRLYNCCGDLDNGHHLKLDHHHTVLFEIL